MNIFIGSLLGGFSLKIVVISTEAQRNGEIYQDRFSFAESSGSWLRCTSLEMMISYRFSNKTRFGWRMKGLSFLQ